MKRMICLSISVLLLLATAFAADFWEKKDYKQWSQAECKKLLEDSPWAKPFNVVSSDAGIDTSQTNRTNTDSAAPYIKYQVQFRSAKPVRQAIVRQGQLAQKYDSLSAAQKQEFDKKADSFISADLSEAVVVYVTYSTNNPDNDRDLARYWQAQTADLLKNTVALSNTKGEKIYLSNFTAEQAAGRSFQFIFPREANGKPLLNGMQDKSLKLEFMYPIINCLGDPSPGCTPASSQGTMGKGYLEFKVDKMIFDGAVSY